MISKACVVGTYQRKLEEIARHSTIDLTVIVPPAWKDDRGMLRLERVHTAGYRLLAEPIRFNGNFHLHYYPTLAQRIADFQPHIVHVDEEPYNLATFHAVRLARRAGAKSLFFTWQNIDRRYPPPFSRIEKWVLRHVDYGIAGTEEAAEVWRTKGYDGPMAVIPQFGVDPDIFSPEPRDQDASADDRPFVIGYAGRLVPEKGLDLAIEAAARLPGKWLLSLAGDGPERERLIEMAGVYNIGGSVHFPGPIASTDMPDYYRSLDALVLPARTMPNWKEQFGRMLIEGMACGVPVIGARSGAIPGVIGDAGLTFPEGDIDALRDCLLSLIEHPRLRQQLIEAGRQRVLEHFTQAQIADRTVKIYRQLAMVIASAT
ncbi:MAG: glycosyltransferase family 4 protein [Anaerolineae bacterium]|nr:glycosyltransferase family 4 protein [Anaerolineae bacterium]